MAGSEDSKPDFQIENFLETQSIQRSYLFTVEFNMLEGVITGNPTLDKFNGDVNHPIKHHHVKNIVMPFTMFKKEYQPMGIFNKQFPLLEDTGYELKIEMQEDSHSTIAQFIMYLQRRIMGTNGVYNNLNKAKIDIKVTTFKSSGTANGIYNFSQCMFMNSSEPNYTYDSSTAISQVLTFSAESVSFDPGVESIDYQEGFRARKRRERRERNAKNK